MKKKYARQVENTNHLPEIWRHFKKIPIYDVKACFNGIKRYQNMNETNGLIEKT